MKFGGRNFTELPKVSYIRAGEIFYFGYETALLFSGSNWKVPPEKHIIRASNDIILWKNNINFGQIESEEVTYP